jgi:hypothetical protein
MKPELLLLSACPNILYHRLNLKNRMDLISPEQAHSCAAGRANKRQRASRQITCDRGFALWEEKPAVGGSTQAHLSPCHAATTKLMSRQRDRSSCASSKSPGGYLAPSIRLQAATYSTAALPIVLVALPMASRLAVLLAPLAPAAAAAEAKAPAAMLAVPRRTRTRRRGEVLGICDPRAARPEAGRPEWVGASEPGVAFCASGRRRREGQCPRGRGTDRSTPGAT